jgi:hypothetical protein
VNFGLLIC